jgi:hypothetical protein
MRGGEVGMWEVRSMARELEESLQLRKYIDTTN